MKSTLITLTILIQIQPKNRTALPRRKQHPLLPLRLYKLRFPQLPPSRCPTEDLTPIPRATQPGIHIREMRLAALAVVFEVDQKRGETVVEAATAHLGLGPVVEMVG